MDDLIALLFIARDLTHKEHLKTRSYAAHAALGAFYPAVIELADSLAEAYQGCEGKLLDIPIIKSSATGGIESVLRQHLRWIERHRKGITDESSIQNIIDEVVSLYQSTLYKLKFLS